MPDTTRLSLNQKTTDRWNLAEAIDGCARAGLDWIGLWREPVQEVGVAEAARMVRAAGLQVSTLCRGGFLTASDPVERTVAIDDNRAAIEEAAQLGTDVLVLVCGGMAAGDLDGARQRVIEGIGELIPTAAREGVRLGIEALHPGFCADRSVVVTLAQALDVAEQFDPSQVGVIVDTYHLWWDPDVWSQIARAGERILSYQVSDWLDPLPDLLLGRGIPGDGVIDFARFGRAVADAGYDGPVEVEIFNHEIWQRDGDEVLAELVTRAPQYLVAPTPTGP